MKPVPLKSGCEALVVCYNVNRTRYAVVWRPDVSQAGLQEFLGEAKLKTIVISEDLAQLLGPDEQLPHALAEAVVLELFREHRISTGKAAELLGMSYREFLHLIQAKNIPLVTTPPRDPGETTDLLDRGKSPA
jgi:hypothetical protein